jgi:hypothetical protein
LPSYRRAFFIGKALCSQPAPVVVAAAFCHFGALALVPIGQFFSGCLSACCFVSVRCTTHCCASQLFLFLFNFSLYKFVNTFFLSYKSQKKAVPTQQASWHCRVAAKSKDFYHFHQIISNS